MNAFDAATYGAYSVGFGDRPAVLVVDFQKGFTDPRCTMGRSPRVHAARDRTVELLSHARRCGVPVASCFTAYHSERDALQWKVAAVRNGFREGSLEAEMDDRIADPSHDYIFQKAGPSIFFQTPLTSFLARHRIDTVIVTGCVTSGCVRASVIDAFSNGYRTIVAEDCCGDPGEAEHEANIKDVGRRYADIATSPDVVAYFEEMRRRNS
ncbi:MAG: isochorismatase family protein [Hyphomicrobiaceae bacterium]|nr:isochorismatase family protein [Hyphomicrobiaceae bacterium]